MALPATGAVADESGSPRPSAVPRKEPPPIERVASGGIERRTIGNPRADGQSEPAESSPSDAGVGLSRPVGPAPANPVTKENQCAVEGELTDPDCRDLAAQERMAYAAWAQVILTAIGVLLIWRTLFHTRVAAEAAKATVVEAKESTRAAVRAADAAVKTANADRAWIVQGDYQATPFNGWIGETRCENGLVVIVEWKNVGRTPALNVAVETHMEFLSPDSDRPSCEFNPMIDETGGAPVGVERSAFSFPLYMNDEQYNLFREERIIAVVFSHVSYRDLQERDVVRRSQLSAKLTYRGERQEHGGPFYPNISLTPFGSQNFAT